MLRYWDGWRTRFDLLIIRVNENSMSKCRFVFCVNKHHPILLWLEAFYHIWWECWSEHNYYWQEIFHFFSFSSMSLIGEAWTSCSMEYVSHTRLYFHVKITSYAFIIGSMRHFKLFAWKVSLICKSHWQIKCFKCKNNFIFLLKSVTKSSTKTDKYGCHRCK